MMTDPSVYLIRNEEEQQLLLEHFRNQCLNGTLQDYNNYGNGTDTPSDGAIYCPKVWDGAMCWNRTLAGILRVQSCPNYIAGLDPKALASKQCMPNGDWYFDEAHQRLWTNLSQCTDNSMATVIVDFKDRSNVTYLADFFPIVKTVSQVGYGVSLTSLIIAFCILASIRKLRCPRNVLHMHLFMSFILRASISLLKDSIFVDGVGLSSDIIQKDGDIFFVNKYNWVCKFVTSLWQYFIMANYSWILMEGMYLHNLIFLAVFSDNSSVRLYIALGWGLPFLFILPWVVIRATLEDMLCWTTNNGSYVYLLIQIPTAVSVILSFIFFINVIRVLLLKLKSSVTEENQTYRKWAKSTLVLVPLFGVHYTLFLGMSYCVSLNPTVEIIWLFCDQLFGSFQGFFVAVLYCFMNSEVRTELKKRRYRIKWNELFKTRRSRKSLRDREIFTKQRQSYPRSSCYSTTSFTSLNGAGTSRKLGVKTYHSPQNSDWKRGSSPICTICTKQNRLSCCSHITEIESTGLQWDNCDTPNYNPGMGYLSSP